jgi:hypothetical protein
MLGGYPVIKKWLSYHDLDVLGVSTGTLRAGLQTLELPTKAVAVEWKDGAPVES